MKETSMVYYYTQECSLMLDAAATVENDYMRDIAEDQKRCCGPCAESEQKATKDSSTNLTTCIPTHAQTHSTYLLSVPFLSMKRQHQICCTQPEDIKRYIEKTTMSSLTILNMNFLYMCYLMKYMMN